MRTTQTSGEQKIAKRHANRNLIQPKEMPKVIARSAKITQHRLTVSAAVGNVEQKYKNPSKGEKEMKFKTMLKRTAESFPMFKSLKVGGFELSIQASKSHYSTPRETFPSAQLYDEFEMAIFEGGEWLNPVHDKRFESLKEELDNVWESGESGVGGYVPSELVQKIYDLVEGFNVE